MSTLATALKKEIQRLAKKEAVAVVKDVKTALRDERKEVRALKGTIKAQAREIASLRKALEKSAASAASGGAVAVKAKSPGRPAKKGAAKKSGAGRGVKAASVVKGWRKDSVGSTRKMHDLSQSAFAKLVGVGLNTVWLWENGRTNPRPKQQEAVLALRELTSRQVGNRLNKLGLTAGKQKPGRKKKAPAAAKTTRKKVTRKKTAKKSAAKAAK